VYLADPDVDGANELFSVPGDGTQLPVRLSPALPAGRRVVNFAVTPDGTRAVYTADQVTDEVYELFVAPIDGSAPAQSIASPPAGDGIYEFLLEPTSTRAFYSFTHYGGGHVVSDLYGALLLPGSSPVLLAHHDDPYDTPFFFPHLDGKAISPDGAW